MNDDRPKVHLLKVMRLMIESPFTYTREQIQTRVGISQEQFKDNLRAFRTGDYDYEIDKKNRYGFKSDKPYNDLKDLLMFSEKDQFLLMEALDQVATHSKNAERLKRKLATLYDFTRSGHPLLRKPYLTKYDLLEKAKKEKKRVVLVQYRSSNSNIIQDRIVEGFGPSLDDDTLQAFDVVKNDLRHFRISRITRIQLTDETWSNEHLHFPKATDPFRIVDNNQVPVRLRLKVGATNELIERFPLTQTCILPDAEKPDEFEFQGKVNHKFIGLTNFILGFHHQVIEILEPDSLVDHLKKEIKKMPFWEE